MTELVEKAEAVAARAYAPYSNYHVGAVVRTDDGREFEGVNVETPPTRSVSAPRRARSWRRSRRVTAPAGSLRSGSTPPPCGGCRQWLAEFRIPEVSFRREDGTVATYEAMGLLPETWDFPDP